MVLIRSFTPNYLQLLIVLVTLRWEACLMVRLLMEPKMTMGVIQVAETVVPTPSHKRADQLAVRLGNPLVQKSAFTAIKSSSAHHL